MSVLTPADPPGAVAADSIDGFDRAPDRYTGDGRETIDRIRDALRAAMADPSNHRRAVAAWHPRR